MKNINRQTLPLGRSTKEEKVGLSLPQPSLFEIDGNAYRYYNDISQNIVKDIPNFIVRLTQKKFFLDICESEFCMRYLHPRARYAMDSYLY